MTADRTSQPLLDDSAAGHRQRAQHADTGALDNNVLDHRAAFDPAKVAHHCLNRIRCSRDDLINDDFHLACPQLAVVLDRRSPGGGTQGGPLT